MAAITVRNLDDDIRDQLRLQAAQHGHSMEAEVRAILTAAVGRRRHRPNALMDLYWSGRVEVEADVMPEPMERETERPRVDFSGDDFG
ncbi:FitA-like ribbon-helix-helix domain-containing protein [Janibacter anophelis]|uniref:FitA-like ribbon-helix-helix domain-containing protein n=1 Tax=Janibacter anophelis TaxID=319054 RepID=UPI003F7E5051